jgi:hypothetical protein
MAVNFELEDDEAVALMQCASVGAVAAQALLGANARQMQPIFAKIQQQFSDQKQTPLTTARNGKGVELAS